MTVLATALVLGAALLHASWNAILRGGADRLWSIAVICGTSAVVALPFVIALPLPAPASWPFIGFSTVVQDVSCFLLVRGYRDGHLAQVYPIARGSSPMLVTLGALAFAGERPSVAATAGIVLISAAILALGFERARPKPGTTFTALAIGVCIAAYTLSDGVGARASHETASYTAWLFLIQGASMPLLFIALRGRLVLSWRDGETRKAIAGGVFGLVSYGVVIWALTLAPMGRVSALRETSVLFAALIGAIFLKERLTGARVVAAVMIAAGAAVLSAAP